MAFSSTQTNRILVSAMELSDKVTNLIEAIDVKEAIKVETCNMLNEEAISSMETLELMDAAALKSIGRYTTLVAPSSVISYGH